MPPAAQRTAAGARAELHATCVGRALDQARSRRLELANIFRQFGAEYRRAHPLTSVQAQALQAIVDCRTAALGGHLERCDTCGLERPAYNSCRNRHCPKCQMLTKAKWLAARRAELLPVAYFHAVFTLPHLLNPLLLGNQRLLYGLLFECAAQTLQEFAADPRHGLGGQLGFTAILHTWNQALQYHVHLHCLIPAGVLACDGKRWIHARQKFLFPVKALALVFRGRFIAGLKTAHQEKRLHLTGQGEPGKSETAFRQLLAQLRKTPWVVYLKPPFGGPAQTLDYLGRYTHRVAISNQRLLKLEAGRVYFRYRDRQDHDTLKQMDLPADEFIRRFLMHVLPKAFVRLRHFGFLANGRKHFCLTRCRELLQAGPPPAKPAEKTVQEWMKNLTGVDITVCPRCQVGKLVVVRELQPQRVLCRAPALIRLQAPKNEDTS